MRIVKLLFVLVSAFGLSAVSLRAQTSTSATALGTVRDPSGGVVAGAQVTLRNVATNTTAEQKTNSVGYYTFLRVEPGRYVISVKATGFESATVSNLTFDVSKSYTVDVTLTVGSTATVVNVTAEAAIELQTTNATIGDVLAGSEMVNLPTITRSAAELLTLQPGATPLAAQGDRNGESGGSVSGARSDQNAVMLDGIDISDIFGAGTPTSETVVPMNVDAMAEFRVGVANPNASAASASGGQVSVASKGGTNSLHGTVYWYLQNTALNANTWENNHIANPLKPGTFEPRAPIHDNRGGFALGGPIKKDKTFFFLNYEPRRFITTYGGNANEELNLPSADYRNGIINWVTPDGVGHVSCLQSASQVTANITSPGSNICNAITPNANGARISSNCGTLPVDSSGHYIPGTVGSLSCDPRGLGMSPTVSTLLSLIKPLPNDPSSADAVGCTTSLSCQNISGYLFNTGAPIQDDAFNVRLDHNFSENLHFFGRYAWFREIAFGLQNPAQVDLTQAGSPLLDNTGTRGESATVGLDWSIRSNLLNSFHFGWIRQRVDFNTVNEAAIANRLKLTGAQDASSNYVSFEDGYAQPPNEPSWFAQPIIAPAGNGVQHGKNIQFTDDLNWIKGNHSLVFGTDLRWQPVYLTADIAQGGVSTPRAISDALGSSSNEPGGDSGPIQHLYDSMLGLIFNLSYYQPLNTSFQPVSGHPIADLETHTHSLYFYAQDSWRIKPSLTLTYGLAWGVQTPYTEDHGRGAVLVDASTNKPVDAVQVLATKKADALKGINYNPTYGYVPYSALGMKGMWNTDWADWAPRASIAWSPSADSGLVGKLFGNGKTVIRAGYAMVYDRYSGGTVTHLPGQPGFNVIPSNNTPPCDASGTPAANCTTGPGVDPASSVFRVGFDGAIPVPGAAPITPVPSATNPFVPGGGTAIGAAAIGQAGNIVFTYNPNFKIGRNHMIDFSVQRELPGNMILEVGYIGRLGRRLPGPYALNADPYMFTDPASGQSYAQANDCVAQTLRYGPVANWSGLPKLGNIGCQSSTGGPGTFVVNGVSMQAQPWFENELPSSFLTSNLGTAAQHGPCFGMTTNTQCILTLQGANFAQGNIGGVFGVFNVITGARCGSLLNTGTLAQLQSCSLYNMQENDLQQRTSTDFSNYHALTVTLRNRGWHGLVYDLNYTFSKSLDQGGRTQGFINGFDDSFNPNAMYGPSYFDRTHVLNATFDYNLPFGAGHKLSAGNGLNRVIGGWSMTGVFRANSGLPLVVAESGFAYGGGLVTTNNVDMIPTGNKFSTGLIHNTGNTATGSCAVYAAAMGGGTSVGGNSSALGLNYFSDPAAAYCSFRPILLTGDTRDGRGNPLRGFGVWNLDASFAKETAITERFKVKFSADFFNIFNHVSFDDPLAKPLGPTDFIDATNAANFGVLTNSFTPAQRPVGSRWIQLGLRVEF
jgi:hypothetical protein